MVSDLINVAFDLSTEIANPSSSLSPLMRHHAEFVDRGSPSASPIPTSVKDPNNNMSDDDGEREREREREKREERTERGERREG